MIIKKHLAEFTGTFILVFLGTGAIIFSEEYKDSFNVFTIALVFGITVSILVYFLGQLSDCHINPAVTITFVTLKKIPIKQGIVYITLQVLGAILASFCWKIIFPFNVNLGNTLTSVPVFHAFLLEFIMSGILLFGILYASIKTPKYTYLIIGSIVFMEAWLAGPFTGASMNPARTIGPTIASANYQHLWIYIVAPIAGMLVFSILHKKYCRQ